MSCGRDDFADGGSCAISCAYDSIGGWWGIYPQYPPTGTDYYYWGYYPLTVPTLEERRVKALERIADALEAKERRKVGK